ncbi:MAG: hypothetical protein ACFE9Z_10130 [Promethearchaeota archaeon]
MSKIPKESENKLKSKKKNRNDDDFAFRSVLISAIFGCILFIISFLFNVEIITIFISGEILFTIIDVILKTFLVLLFFIFITTSYGNYKELVGKPLNWKDLLVIIVLSIGQTIMNLWVFALTLFGVFIILIYLYLVQEF